MSNIGFPKSVRLLKATEFKRVFDHTELRSSSPQLLLLAAANEDNHARLGFVIAKKQIKHAVDRNRVKRIVRESFRHHQEQLPSVDFVVLGRAGLAELDNSQIRAMIDALWFRLKRPNNDRTANHRQRPRASKR